MNHLHHHFDTHEQQQEAASLGMWVFLATEVLFFGVVFMGYTYVRWAAPDVFEASSRHLDVLLGSINTALLLTSSFIMAAGVFFAEAGRHRTAALCLAVTAVMGIGFLAVKGTEYGHVIHEGFFPGYSAQLDKVMQPGGGYHGRLSEGGGPVSGFAQLFFWLYFVMTGLHALHVLIGVVLLGWIAVLLRRPDQISLNTVRNAGLYWHFVDLVWVFLFPLLYLVGHR